MAFEIITTEEVAQTIEGLQRRDIPRYRKVVKCLAHLAQDPRHPGLRSHPYEQITGPLGEKVWESYVENHNPAAWRVWWSYGPEEGDLTVFGLGPHP